MNDSKTRTDEELAASKSALDTGIKHYDGAGNELKNATDILARLNAGETLALREVSASPANLSQTEATKIRPPDVENVTDNLSLEQRLAIVHRWAEQMGHAICGGYPLSRH